ncbi:MAG TPA: hypothetical protein VIL88_02545 [Devosia sp.]|jgi:hypothetical protein|uniref:hypothetical protein n=1 Tax=Devosia sp. TaxID=1871048 RepID=UPI002F95ECB2
MAPGYWTETYFTTDPNLLQTIAKMSAMVPKSAFPEGAEVKAQVSQRTLMLLKRSAGNSTRQTASSAGATISMKRRSPVFAGLRRTDLV